VTISDVRKLECWCYKVKKFHDKVAVSTHYTSVLDAQRGVLTVVASAGVFDPLYTAQGAER